MIDKVLAERQKTHGSFSDHARITQEIKSIFANFETDEGAFPYKDLSDQHKEAIDMIAHKIGRIMAGNPNHRDHWLDIAGYAMLGEDYCKPRVAKAGN